MEDLTNRLHVYVDALPIGSIILWCPPAADAPLPPGWEVCDGGPYSYLGKDYRKPDLRGQFVRGGTPQQANQRGGKDAHVLTAAQLPQHNHSFKIDLGREPSALFNELAASSLPENTPALENQQDWQDYKLMAPSTYNREIEVKSGVVTVYDRGATPQNQNANARSIGDILPGINTQIGARQNTQAKKVNVLVQTVREAMQLLTQLAGKKATTDQAGGNESFPLLPTYTTLCYLIKIQ